MFLTNSQCLTSGSHKQGRVGWGEAAGWGGSCHCRVQAEKAPQGGDIGEG